ncbi:MAG: L-aspartate oxidase [Planctomycetota bacterium]|nr:MAG: L-aspartate oxidase [Planctomycetota bacterium]
MHLHPIDGIATTRYLLGFDLRRKPHLDADVLVIGSGIAGCVAALAAAENDREVLLLTKGELQESNTRYAQGGIAAVLDDQERDLGDSIEQHVQDTLQAGGGLCDELQTREILKQSAQAITFLRRHGCRFDGEATGTGKADLTREGGHRFRRILHAHGDSTGAEISQSLRNAVLQHPLITVREHSFSLDLLKEDGRVVGALYHRRGEIYAALAGSTVLATGGCGRMWRETTNPTIATGDGLAMAYRAGATVADCEFMQFHPTTLYLAGAARLLITEAMRGEGAVLKNHAGEAFMARYHRDGDLAPRDIVSQGIIAEIRNTRFPHVWLDASHLGQDYLRQRFPTIFGSLQEFGIDISRDWIPVHPSAHYHCGGVITDAQGRSTISGLFAAGEVACTGLHGANRLASNSILEGVICGLQAGIQAAAEGGFPGRIRISQDHYPAASSKLDIPDLLRSLRAMMWRNVGVERDHDGLSTALRSIGFWADHQARGALEHEAGWELQNMLLVSQLVTAMAHTRTASLGTHLRKDSHAQNISAHLTMTRPERADND